MLFYTTRIPVVNPVSGRWSYMSFVANKKAIFLDAGIKRSDGGKTVWNFYSLLLVGIRLKDFVND